jgi:hypothetical protein
MVLSLKLWLADLSLPFAYGGDAILGLSSFKTVLETGWYEVQPLLNAPHEQVMHDYKIADNLVFILVKLGGLFTHNPSMLLNIYFLVGFPLAALTALWFFKLLKVRTSLAIGLAILYSIAPYHFARGEVHVILGAYWPLPLAFGIVFLIATNQSIWRVREPTGRFALWGAGSAVMTIVALAVIGSANSYYALFILLFIALFGLSNGIRARSWTKFWGAVFAGVLLLVTMIINMLPDIVVSMRNGENFAAVSRSPYGVEFYSLRLTELILPNNDSRIPGLSSIRSYYMNVMQVGGEQPILGFIASLGFVSLIALSIYFLFSVSRPPVPIGHALHCSLR